MLNFIPEKNKGKIITEYFFRFFTYFLLFSFFTLVVLISLFLPSNFYSKYKNNNISGQLSSIKGEVGENNEDPIEIIKDVNKYVKIFVNEKEKTQFSDIIQKIISLKNKNIKISSISVINDVGDTVKIVINGISGTRDSLTSFDRELKNEGYFQSVELPVSNLIKNIDSDFTMTLIYKK
ncbi:MAG: hypothetical protein WC827_00620 [Candidatus Paceibacterota bacterium]|jgi:predicted CopG family antitoxin